MKLIGQRKTLGAGLLLLTLAGAVYAEDSAKPLTYRRFEAREADGGVVSMTPIPADPAPRWAREVSQKRFDWTKQSAKRPFFAKPQPFVLPPADAAEPFYKHNHQPSITWLPNGDLLAIWYSTRSEYGPVLTVVASRLRPGKQAWDPCSEFFKAPNCNMHGSSIFHDGRGTIYHFNGMAPKAKASWRQLALLMRSSRDNGVTWTPPKAIDNRFIARHQVISGTLMTKDGTLIQGCDSSGGTALHISRDKGKTWTDPGEGKPSPTFTAGRKGRGTIAGIHAKVVELSDGRFFCRQLSTHNFLHLYYLACPTLGRVGPSAECPCVNLILSLHVWSHWRSGYDTGMSRPPRCFFTAFFFAICVNGVAFGPSSPVGFVATSKLAIGDDLPTAADEYPTAKRLRLQLRRLKTRNAQFPSNDGRRKSRRLRAWVAPSAGLRTSRR